MEMNYNTPLSEISLGQLIDAMKKEMNLVSKIETEQPQHKQYVYGLIGLAKLLGCSRATAYTIKKSGVLDEAISQNGRKIIVDADLAVKLFNKKI